MTARIQRLVECSKAVVMMAFLAVCGVAFADNASNSVQSISATAQQGGKVAVRIALKNKLTTLPPSFTVNNPARIAFDFGDTMNESGKASHDLGEGDLRSASIVQAGKRLRLVLNLTKLSTYDAQIDGNVLMVVLQPPAATSGAQPVVQHFAESVATSQPGTLRDVSFRRGPNGEARVIVDLSDNNTGIDIKSQGKNLTVEFVKTKLPRNLERRLDVTDFGTPVDFVDAFSQGNNVRLVIEPKGLWEHSAYQTNNQFIVEVKSVAEDPNRLVQGVKQGYGGEKLSLNFQNVEVRSVLQVIADFTGLNIVTSDTVTGSLTLRLKDVPWDQALDLILNSKNLDKRKNGNIIWVARRDEIAAFEKQQLEASKQLEDLEPVVQEIFRLSYINAEDIRKAIVESAKSAAAPGGAAAAPAAMPTAGLLSNRGVATADVRTNTLTVRDTRTVVEDLRRYLKAIDVPVRQVMVEARIVIADDKFSKQLGARFGVKAQGMLNNTTNAATSGTISNSSTLVPNTGSSGVDANNLDVTRGSLISSGVSSDGLNVNLPVTGAAGSIGLTLLNLGKGALVNLELSAMEADGVGKVISSPRVITADNQPSVIKQGTQIGYITPASGASAVPAVAFKDAVLSLEVTPRIMADDRIEMQLKIKKDSVGALLNNIPSIDTKEVTISKVMVGNGETAVLGGIFEQTIRKDVSKVPVLGDIPVFGNLFKSTSQQDDKTELIIFITPKILSDQLSVR